MKRSLYLVILMGLTLQRIRQLSLSEKVQTRDLPDHLLGKNILKVRKVVKEEILVAV